MNLKGKSFLKLLDLTNEEMASLLDLAADLKAKKKAGIPHNVLNAKYHEMEAQIVAQAGKLGAVTIATNMAGRGTDIMLGGNAEYLAKSELRKADMPEELALQR